MNIHALWFGRIVLLGVAANMGLAAYGLITPNDLLTLLGLGPAEPVVWPRFAALLLALLSLFYIPAGLDPLTNRTAAMLAVLARCAGVLFFGLHGGPYLLLALFDFVFGLPQGILLALALRQPLAVPSLSNRI
jgi:hypothetical protein